MKLRKLSGRNATIRKRHGCEDSGCVSPPRQSLKNSDCHPSLDKEGRKSSPLPSLSKEGWMRAFFARRRGGEIARVYGICQLFTLPSGRVSVPTKLGTSLTFSYTLIRVRQHSRNRQNVR